MPSHILGNIELKFRKSGERIDQNNPFSIDCQLKENPKPISVSASSTAQQQICVCLLFAIKVKNLSYRPKLKTARPARWPVQVSLSISGLSFYHHFSLLTVLDYIPCLSDFKNLETSRIFHQTIWIIFSRVCEL